jgi:BirA family biotin operon repressor/biotin-[acetyl-CoA-carboxylase] ligase
MFHRPLTAADLLAHGPCRRIGQRVVVQEVVDSTNQFLLERAAEFGDGAIAWAEYQTAGRGRLGRRWAAPRGSSVLLSVLLLEPPDTPLLTLGALLAALAACEGIEQASDCHPGVRWPNDIVHAGRKLGGVLAESCAVPERDRRVVVIGINCLQQRGHFPGELARTATSLECESHQPVDRAAVAAGLVARLDHWLLVCGQDTDRWRDVRRAWQARCEDTGQRVRLEHDGRIYSGTALEVADDGDLVVELDAGGRRRFSAATTTRLVPASEGD